jgi:Ca2+-binding EF-hand superfamily protein
MVLAKMDKNNDGKISKEEMFSTMREFLGPQGF